MAARRDSPAPPEKAPLDTPPAGPSSFPTPLSVRTGTIPRTPHVPGGTMRNTTIVTLLAAALALTGCGSSDSSSEPDKPAKATVTVTATPKLSREETKLQCTDAISEAAPGWEDWNYSPGEWADDPRTPDVCQGLVDEDDPTQGNRDFLQALLDGLDAADDPRAEQ